MKDKQMKGNLFHDDAPTGSIEKFSLSDLHFGDHEVPLSALGEQDVVVPSDMGRDHQVDHGPIHKGSTVDEQHYGKKGQGYSENSKSSGRGSKK